MKDKKYLRVLTRTKNCPLKLNSLLVFSYLASRAGKDTSYTQSFLSKKVGVGKNRLPQIRRELLDAGLLTIQEARWRANEPTGEAKSWFVPLEDKKWYRSIAFWRLYLPSPTCPLSLNQRAVLWLLMSLKINRSELGLAKMLKLDRRTVHSCLEVLIENGLARRTARGLKGRNPGKLDWWQDTEKPSKNYERQPEKPTIEKVLQGKTSAMTMFLGDLHKEGYLPEEIQEVYETSRRTEFGMMPSELRTLYTETLSQHRSSQSNSRFVGESSAKLFLYKLKKFVEAAIFRQQQANRTYLA